MPSTFDQRLLELTAAFGYLIPSELDQLTPEPTRTLYRHLSTLSTRGLITKSNGLVSITPQGITAAGLIGYNKRNPAKRNEHLVAAYLTITNILPETYRVKTHRQAKAEQITSPACDLLAVLPGGKDLHYLIDNGTMRISRIRAKTDTGITVLSIRGAELRDKGIQVVSL